MKRFFFLFIVILVFSQFVFASENGIESDDKRDRKITLQLSPLFWFTDIFTERDEYMFMGDLEFQARITKYSNLSLTFGFKISSLYTDDWIALPDYYVYDYYYDRIKRETLHLSFKPMYIYRPFGTGIDGFYLGFYPLAGFIQHTSNNKKEILTEVGGGFNIGYKAVFNSGFTMQIGGGIGKSYYIPRKYDNEVFITPDGRIHTRTTDLFLVDFKLGYSF